ncbi:MAG: hypothetical protein ACI9JY_001506, partial [Saprospiraceae bacterium]
KKYCLTSFSIQDELFSKGYLRQILFGKRNSKRYFI